MIGCCVEIAEVLAELFPNSLTFDMIQFMNLSLQGLPNVIVPLIISRRPNLIDDEDNRIFHDKGSLISLSPFTTT